MSQLESEIIKQKLDLESAYDLAILAARENEREKLNETIQDLKQRSRLFPFYLMFFIHAFLSLIFFSRTHFTLLTPFLALSSLPFLPPIVTYRVQMFLTSRAEYESRCQGYVKEIHVRPCARTYLLLGSCCMYFLSLELMCAG